jgi:glutaminase
MLTGAINTDSNFVNKEKVSRKNGSMRKEDIVLIDEIINDNPSSEKTLFLCVILQALLDATKPSYDGEPDSSIHERDRAVAWFFASVGVTAEDFTAVCDFAGVNPVYMREFAFKVLRSGEVEYVRKRINAVLGH